LLFALREVLQVPMIACKLIGFRRAVSVESKASVVMKDCLVEYSAKRPITGFTQVVRWFTTMLQSEESAVSRHTNPGFLPGFLSTTSRCTLPAGTLCCCILQCFS
jgi:hypothetical protein